MARYTLQHNLEPGQLLASLAALALAEGIGEPLVRSLRASEDTREPTREAYLREAFDQFVAEGQRLDQATIDNTDRALSSMLELPRPRLVKASRDPGLRWLRRRRRGLLLSQEEIEELLDLIRAHYRIMIRVGITTEAGISPATERRWRALGVIRPDVRIAGLVSDAFVAGRLEQLLNDGNSLEDVRRMAREFPMPREASLSLQALQTRVRWDLSGGVGYRFEEQAGQLIAGINARRVNEIVALYRRGELRHTPTNRSGLSPEEAAATETDTAVQGWRGVARELRNRMARDDRTRDWERVATSSLRLSANLGAIGAMAEQGVAFLYYDVHANACAHCKRLYLNEDGTPRQFPIAELLGNIEATGGANYGRKASQIGDPEAGWLPNALAHPWCQCRPKRVIRGAPPQARQ